MREIWSDQARMHNWMQIEVLAAEAMAQLGIVPQERSGPDTEESAIRRRPCQGDREDDPPRRGGVPPEPCGEHRRARALAPLRDDILGRAGHRALPSSCATRLTSSSKTPAGFSESSRTARSSSSNTPMMGRTHGVHAEPMTFGLKLAVWAFETERNLERLLAARDMIAVGKLSGAVGTYASIDPFVEQYVCKQLGLEPGRGVEPDNPARPPRAST